jgi:flagellar basal-body rod protein FlgB
VLARGVEEERAEDTMRILDSVERLRSGLDYHLARHNLLTANLAHVDTPNFKPLDLEKQGDFKAAMSTALASTNPSHLAESSASSKAGESFKVIEDKSAAAGPDGNGVSVDREAVKIATNHVRYETLASLTSNELSGLVWAANDGKNL